LNFFCVSVNAANQHAHSYVGSLIIKLVINQWLDKNNKAFFSILKFHLRSFIRRETIDSIRFGSLGAVFFSLSLSSTHDGMVRKPFEKIYTFINESRHVYLFHKKNTSISSFSCNLTLRLTAPPREYFLK